MEISVDITKLREEGRPLWMSRVGISSYAEMLGGGGDIYTDRLVPEWERFSGEELVGDEEMEAASMSESDPAGDFEFLPKSELGETVEEVFKYVHKPDTN